MKTKLGVGDSAGYASDAGGAPRVVAWLEWCRESVVAWLEWCRERNGGEKGMLLERRRPSARQAER